MASEEQKNIRTSKQAEKEDTPKQKKKRKEVKSERKQQGAVRRFISSRIRFIPVWLRVVLIIVLCFAAFYIGLDVGYTKLGDGEDADTVRSLDFWKDMWSYIQGE
ncbi:DNA-directed RNA polymerase subunit beta [Piscibacillus halophilus]|mgnify:CR=1 FL=1|uniref:DNA-directed RNA polymerase subunit beta n=1 Tax=Piscibacillus halophilus TaxID=571933 RepID=A0A1H9KJ34_9BACI|nr:DNA-directed RNA polymerase subunit beta [Piscibacillus halophilus]SEQ99171.1 DNA-directed RNA polymerase subunit beta [Piscibacillus halophilus]